MTILMMMNDEDGGCFVCRAQPAAGSDGAGLVVLLAVLLENSSN